MAACPFRASMRYAVAGLVLASLLASVPAIADRLISEDAATAAGQALVDKAVHGGVDEAVHGGVDEAFRSANALRRPADTAFESQLAQRQQTLREELAKLGSAGTVRLAGTEYFAGCIHREYRVSYDGGSQFWRLKFRRGANGWFLTDLAVVGPA